MMGSGQWRLVVHGGAGGIRRDKLTAAKDSEIRAGLTVVVCGFSHLAFAQEIAGAMLSRQQAQALVASRKTLV